MKKIILILSTIMILFTSSISFAAPEMVDSTNITKEFNLEISGENKGTGMPSMDAKDDEKEELTPATDKVLSNMSKKEKKIAEYTDKYNDATFGNVAYWLEVVQTYSIPVFIIFLAIGAFNYFIIGEKKLDKKEQGFGYIVAALVGFTFFQVLPLLFALIVARVN